jgi:GTP-binding protein HflX
VQAIAERLADEMVAGQLILPVTLGRLRAKLYQQQAIAEEKQHDDGSCELTLRIPKSDFLRMLNAESLKFEELNWAPAK